MGLIRVRVTTFASCKKKYKKMFFQIFKIDSGIYLILLSDHLIAFDIEGDAHDNII